MSLALALRRPVDAVCTFYGGGMQQLFDRARHGSTRLCWGCFGDQDQSIPVGTVEEFDRLLGKDRRGTRSGRLPEFRPCVLSGYRSGGLQARGRQGRLAAGDGVLRRTPALKLAGGRPAGTCSADGSTQVNSHCTPKRQSSKRRLTLASLATAWRAAASRRPERSACAVLLSSGVAGRCHSGPRTSKDAARSVS